MDSPALLLPLLILALVSFIPTLWLPYIGEEAVYTITSLEMIWNQDWLAPTLYGRQYGRPPFFNWLIIFIISFLGTENILLASRLVTISATFASGFVLMQLVKQLLNNKTLAIFSALIYFSGDLLFRRGWLAYSDPLFSFFVFSSIACAWIAIDKKRPLLFSWIPLLLSAAFLTKALTCYAFYGLTLIILGYRYRCFRFLAKPFPVIMHILTLLFPLFWTMIISPQQGNNMITDVISKLSLISLPTYMLKIVSFPFESFLRWLPFSLIAVYFLYQKRPFFIQKEKIIKDQNNRIPIILMTAIPIFLINYVPYWLAPETYVRYLLPLYPIAAIIFALFFWQQGTKTLKMVLFGICISLIIKFGLAMFGYQYYEKHYRGNYLEVAHNIMQKTKGHPVYTKDFFSPSVMSVIAHIDAILLKKSMIMAPSDHWQDGFILKETPDLNMPESKVVHHYLLGRHSIYLVCLGRACLAQDER